MKAFVVLIILCLATTTIQADARPTQTGDVIGSVTMLPDGSLDMILWSVQCDGTAAETRIKVVASQNNYRLILNHVGGLRPSETKAVLAWPTPPCQKIGVRDPSVDEMQIRTFMAEVYGPYLSGEALDNRSWENWTDRDLYSNQTTQLIRKWRSVHTEADDINDQDGLCDCQARDGQYAFDIQSSSFESPDRATVRVETHNGTVGPARLTFELVKENGKWRIDDIYWASRNLGMKDALHRIIAGESAR